MPASKVTVKDMRIGQFDYDLAEVLPSPIFHVQKAGVWSDNFMFACLQDNLADMVLVENEVCKRQLTKDRLHAVRVQTLSAGDPGEAY